MTTGSSATAAHHNGWSTIYQGSGQCQALEEVPDSQREQEHVFSRTISWPLSQPLSLPEVVLLLHIMIPQFLAWES